MNIAFYTVTNRNYFTGTVATLSSIRTFYPDAPIHVFAESRDELYPEQVAHVSKLRGVAFHRAAEIQCGVVREAWQMKAHAARVMAESFGGVLIQVDSDAVLCSRLDEIVGRVVESGLPAGGRDGNGDRYGAATHGPYVKLCDSEGNGDGFNPNYISSSVLFLPLPQVKDVLKLWSMAVDESHFGPQPADKKKYAGHGDQGIFNAILYFKGIVPLVLDNESLSEHWAHGAKLVTFSEGKFWKGSTQQLAFHTVGNVPKFWAPRYRERVEANPNLREVYLYWLYQLFDGPCGFLKYSSIEGWKRKAQSLVPEGNSGLIERYLSLRQSELKRVISGYGRLASTALDLPVFQKTSENVLCSLSFDGYIDYRRDVHYFYSAVKRFQNYRLLGGTADLVIFVNDFALEKYATQALIDIASEFQISIVRSSSEELQRLFLAEGIDIERMRLGCNAWIEKGKREGRFMDGVDENWPNLVAIEVYIGRLLLVSHWAQKNRYTRCALGDADGGRYNFEAGEIPDGCHVDDIWRFDEFTDLVHQEISTGKADFLRVSNAGIREIFNLRRDGEFMPMFQTNGHWVQGTAPAFRRYVQLAMDETKRFYLLGFYPNDELVTTSVILSSSLWPEFGSIAGHSLRKQIEVTNGFGEPWYRPFYAQKGEEKYVRHFLKPPKLDGRYAVCITAFDEPSEKNSRKYSKAAAERVYAYREILKGTMDVHVFTDNPEMQTAKGVTIHITKAEEITMQWDSRATFDALVEMQYEAREDTNRHKCGQFLKNPLYACGMLSKLMAVEKLVAAGYDGILSADADGAQFSRDTIGALGRMHVDSIWTALKFHPLISYVVGSATEDSFNVWLSTLREISSCKGGNSGPVDWIWGPCWMIDAKFSVDFLAAAKQVFTTFIDRRLVFYDEHILNCTYNLPQFDDNPLGGMRDLGDPALVGYRGLNPKSFLRYKRWGTEQKHTGRRHREKLWYDRPDFSYES